MTIYINNWHRNQTIEDKINVIKIFHGQEFDNSKLSAVIKKLHSIKVNMMIVHEEHNNTILWVDSHRFGQK